MDMTMMHVASGFHFVIPHVLGTLLLLFLLAKFARRGGLGPVRWQPRPHGERQAPWAQPSPEEEALATLADRLAKGEISPEEYLERSSVLRNATSSS